MKKIVPLVIMALFLLGVGCQTVQPVQEVDSATSESTTTIEDSVLDLSHQGLTKIPDAVFSQTNLTQLNVSDNNIAGAIQAEIRNLSRLQVLNASHNNMTGLPAEIGQLSNLEVLDLSYNNLTGLPHELGNLSNLKLLDLRGNAPSEFDLEIIRSRIPQAEILVD